MRVAFGAIFQNGMRHIDRFVAQYYSLVAYAPEHTFDPILVEGDSTDNDATWNRLNRMFPGHVHRRSLGGPVYGSVDNDQRWKQVSYACNGVLEQVKPEHDALLWIESDLIWEATIPFKMLDWLNKVEAIFPMVMAGEIFYDTWAFKQGGKHFVNGRPFHSALSEPSIEGLHKIESGGSCWAVRGEAARACRFTPPEHAMRGFCEDMRKHGYRLWLDPSLAVEHPR